MGQVAEGWDVDAAVVIDPERERVAELEQRLRDGTPAELGERTRDEERS